HHRLLRMKGRAHREKHCNQDKGSHARDSSPFPSNPTRFLTVFCCQRRASAATIAQFLRPLSIRRSVMRIPGAVSLVLAGFLAAAPSAFAQASITGTVR